MNYSLWLLTTACLASGVEQLHTPAEATAPAMVQPAPVVAKQNCDCNNSCPSRMGGLCGWLHRKLSEHDSCCAPCASPCMSTPRTHDCGKPCATPCQRIVKSPCPSPCMSTPRECCKPCPAPCQKVVKSPCPSPCVSTPRTHGCGKPCAIPCQKVVEKIGRAHV